MATTNAVWGIEIGQCALKAIKLRPGEEGRVEVVAFDLIEHPKILSQPDADPEELIRGALEKFVSRNDWQGDQFVVGVPGQQTFARFTKLPPVDQKKIPDLVRFEASQQIPFDIEEVVWDYQAFMGEDSPDVEVGIFAMRKDLVRRNLDYFTNVGIAPIAVQTIPSALYNFCRFDLVKEDSEAAVVLIDVGAQNTDLIVVEPNAAWMRNIPLGGNSFTEALVRAFKLSFAKAESLKRTAASSKYARQIFQAMRPVFADLVSEIQRSIGFYSSTHRDVELKTVIALGNAFRLPGLQKYLENNLTISQGVTKLDKFRRIVPSSTANAPQFTENILSFGAAYGLAVQGLGMSRIKASLLPTELARIAVWKKKRPYFLATAACLGLAAAFPWARTFLDKQALASSDAEQASQRTQQIISKAKRLSQEYDKVHLDSGEQMEKMEELLELQEKKALVPRVIATVYESIPEPAPELANVSSATELKRLVESGRLIRPQRRQFQVENLVVEYSDDILNHEFKGGIAGAVGRTAASGQITMGGRPQYQEEGAPAEPGFYVYVEGRLLYSQVLSDVAKFVTDEFYANLRKMATRPGLGFHLPPNVTQENGQVVPTITEPFFEKYYGAAQGVGPGTGTGARDDENLRDPVTGEDMTGDWRVSFGIRLRLGDAPQTEGEPPADE